MGEEVGFPTQGELIRFAFRFSGVLPEKQDASLARGATRNNVRRAIDRLALDDGKLEENFERLLRTLSELVSEHVEWPPVRQSLGDVLGNLLEEYQTLISTEGTFLSKRETVRWLIRDRWTSQVTSTLARSAAMWHPTVFLPLRPAGDSWFLPDFGDTGVVWPLSKALKWLYETAGVSQTEFHYPKRAVADGNVERHRHLENAQNWIHGRSLPSAPALRHSLQQALDDRPDKLGVLDEPAQRQSAQTVLFLARGSTAIWQAIVTAYGTDFAAQVRDVFLRQWRLLMAEMAKVECQITRDARAYGVAPDHPELRRAVFQEWAEETRYRSDGAQEELQRHVVATGRFPPESVLQQLAVDHGEFPVEFLTFAHRLGSLHECPPHFAEAFGEWERLRQAGGHAFEDVDAFAARLRENGLGEVLCWMPPWLRFIRAYRAGDHEKAWTSIVQAYESARYRAGRPQYEIVNQFVEMAAKRGDAAAFRRGVHWARYIGLQIRWIRDAPLTRKNLQFAMGILGRANYGV
ncbi:hypothetical protein [Hydrogenophaga sp.]|uniref:hypothetical protein n=1 Tax=Hydrogenophaga sp. TaxID=1904254 RepID=UPI002728D39B|nr:hypothetical protein [Hydrogenophaga sp.]MDO9134175.1 hypothetical protein [Hydrogenophaga sp.]